MTDFKALLRNFTLTTDVGDLDAFGEITGGGGYEDLLPHTRTGCACSTGEQSSHRLA